MQEKPKLRELIAMVRDGDQESLDLLLQRLHPVVQRYARRLGDSDAYPDLVLWLAGAIVHYQPPEDKHHC
jgi:hypothetical protein